MAAALLAGAAAVLAPSLAEAATDAPAEGGGLLAVAAAGLAWLRRRRNGEALEAERRAAETERLVAVLATAPAAYAAWNDRGLTALSPSFAGLLGVEAVAGIEDVVAALAPEDGAALQDGFARLQAEGEGFRHVATTADGARRLELTGRRGDGGAAGRLDVLWAEDVTAREAASSSRLDEAETREAGLYAMLDALPFPVWLRRPDLSLAWVNQAYIRAVDALFDEVLTRQSEFAAGAVADGGRALARRAQASGRTEQESHRLVVGGERKLMRFSETPIQGGAILGWAVDMTELADAQSELERHIAAHAEVLEQLQTAIAIYGPDKRLTFYNQAYVALGGLEEAWLETQPTLGEVMEAMREQRRLPEVADFRSFKKAELDLFTSLIEPREDLLHLPDGTTLRRVITPHPFGGLLFVLEDVTSRLTLERSYNTLLEVQRETLDNLAEGIAVYGSDGRLRLSNPAFARIWNIPADDLAGEPHVGDVTARMQPFFAADGDWPDWRRLLVTGALERQITRRRIERADGTVLDYSTMPLPDGGVLNSYLDVTDSAKVEQALRASNEALGTADRLKSEFIANVSYQLRTPLNTILGFADMLRLRYTGDLNPRQLEYAENIVSAAQGLERLINDILDIATIEAGYMALELKTVDVRALLQSVLDLTRDWAAKQGLRLAVDCPDGIGTIEADERRIKQALYNLVSNAVKFTEVGGSITLAAERGDEWVRLTVRDTGIGIPEADRERAFGRFERIHPNLRQSGVGLGLALVKSFVELHGGRVELTSEPGVGTTVSCLLPIHPIKTLLPPQSGGLDLAFGAEET